MKPDDLPEHVRPNLSRLEAYRQIIAMARRRHWPFRAIAELLLELHGLQISGRSVSDFCRRRGIVKGKGETRKQTAAEPAAVSTDALAGLVPTRPRKRQATGERFVPHDGPLRTRSNGLLKDE